MKQEINQQVQRIYALLNKRRVIKALLLDNRDNFTPAASALMGDLAKFCYVTKPTIKISKVTQNIDPYAMAVAEGRREVFMRIIEILNFSEEKALRAIEQLNQQEKDSL